MTTELPLPDPVRARGFFRDVLEFTTGPIELDHRIQAHADINIVDVRDAEDYAKGHIPGAISLPRGQWGTFAGLFRDKPNVLCCYTQTCHLAAEAALLFARNGYPVMELKGGFAEWQRARLKVERVPSFAKRLQKAA